MVKSYCISTIVDYLMPNPLVYTQTVLFQTIQFSISTYFCLHTVKCKDSSFQTIQFCEIIEFRSIRPIDRTFSDATTPGKSGPGSDGNDGVQRISQSSSNTELSPSDCLVSYLGHSLGEFYPSEDM